METIIYRYRPEDIPEMMKIWNQVVEEGNSFPQTEILTEKQAACFFEEQSFCGVAKIENKVVGLYILHPNNVGRCGHIANASYGIEQAYRGMRIGSSLVGHCLKMCEELGFRGLQFNAVVCSNHRAIALYEKLGFQKIGIIPEGFYLRDEGYEDICIFYKKVRSD